MIRELSLVRGGTATLLRYSEQDVVLETGFASPPGSSLDVLISGSRVSVKVRACRRSNTVDPPRFSVEGRFVNLSREQREALRTK
ncbi:MAG TPA: hypothetical protein VIM73_06195 [Polyangiaceae bacterium]